MKNLIHSFLFQMFFIWVSLFFVSCASPSKQLSAQESAPCEDCGKRGDIDLKVHSISFYREWNPISFDRLDSNAVLGVLPAQKITVIAPSKCNFCHTFSEDALDFDLARVEDSLFAQKFPNMQRELLFLGARIPEADSIWFRDWKSKLLSTPWIEGESVSSLSPWQDRVGLEQTLDRVLPMDLATLLQELSLRYHIRYLSIPLLIEVEVFPKKGKKGGYSWKTLWTFWDARYAKLVFLTFVDLMAETKTRVPPDRYWAEPFAAFLWRMLNTDPSTIENH